MVAPQQSIHKTIQAPNGAAEAPKATADAKTEPTSVSPPGIVPQPPDDSSMPKELQIKDSLTIIKENSAVRTAKGPNTSQTSPGASNTDNAPIDTTLERPKKTVSLDEKPKRTKTGFFSRSKLSGVFKKQSKNDKIANEGSKIIKSILKTSNVITTNASDHKLKRPSHEETSREKVIKDILFEQQPLPQHIKPKLKTPILPRDKESEDATEPTDSNEKDTNSKTSES